MKHTPVQFISVLSIVLLLFSCNNQPQRNLYPETLVGGFNLLPSQETGIDFNNAIRESKKFHHYYFGQIYLGSGVAIGDINNDGLLDVFFGGNQVSDRLYLNKGDFKFEDITKKSKTARNSGWTWGVTMVDINNDGFLDIYVSRNGNSFKPSDRRNQLYINNQDLTFTESAQKYGLGDIGFSTEAVFFDMDNDGDLDMYQVNQPADKKLLLVNKITKKDVNSFKDKLYRNDNGKFKDVSEAAGISRKLAYGLSASVSDFNNDGYIDLYVANDYAEPDYMYYNNGDGTFKNVIHKELKHITQLSMGTDTGDINNDGLLDLMTTDMTPEDHYRSKTNMASMSTEVFNMLVDAGAHRQYMTNTLQVNTGLGSFSDIGNMAGVSSTDWSWASLIVDIDNDGWKDIIVSNGIKKDVDNNDYKTILDTLNTRRTTVDDFFKLSQNAPSQPIGNYAFRNKGNLQFEKVSKAWGFATPSFSSGMAYGDLDNDGDLDVVVNNMESAAFIYENNATGNFIKFNLEGSENNRFGIGAKVIITYNEETQMAQNVVNRGYLSSVAPQVFFGLGKTTEVATVKVIWPDGKINILNNVSANTTVDVAYADAVKDTSTSLPSPKYFTELMPENLGIAYEHKENDFDEYQEQILLPHNISQNGPFSAVADVNNDGLEDLFIGGALGQAGSLYLQKTDGKFILSDNQVWQQDKASEDLNALFFDAEGDGDMDLFVTSGGSEYKRGDYRLKDRLYINNGKGNFKKNDKAIPNIFESSQTAITADVDNDGDTDIFVGTRLVEGKYTFPATSYLLLNTNGVFSKAPKEMAPALTHVGMVTDAVFSDIDGDTDQDLIMVGEWMTIKVLININGVFKDETTSLGLDDTRGIWWSITKNDIDNDGDDDYIIGNLGKNNKFKASETHPFKVFANDFDNNGTHDVVLAKFYKDDYVPMRGRECTSQQMPYITEKFKDYNSFASSKLIDILPEDKITDAVVYEIKSFESIILINESGTLIKKALPNQAQIAPLKSAIVMDVNKDGFKDIITVGNHYGVEVETTRYDAGFGNVLLGDGKLNFTAVPPSKTGFFVPKDSRDITMLNSKAFKYLFTTNNNDKPTIFKFNSN